MEFVRLDGVLPVFCASLSITEHLKYWICIQLVPNRGGMGAKLSSMLLVSDVKLVRVSVAHEMADEWICKVHNKLDQTEFCFFCHEQSQCFAMCRRKQDIF